MSTRRTKETRTTQRWRLPRETFGVLRDRGFDLTVFCDPCKEATRINLVERPDLAAIEIGNVDFECRNCGRVGHYRLEPPFRREKRRLHEQAIGCRGPADDDGTPFVGPFPMLTALGNTIGDFAALGHKLLVTCPGGRERLIDPRCVEWHRLHPIDFFDLRLRCEGCRQRATVLLAPSWYRRRGFNVVRASKLPELRPPEPEREGTAFSALQDVDEIWRRKKAESDARSELRSNEPPK